MKFNKIKIFIFIFFIFFAYLYFDNKLNINESFYNINKYDIKTNNLKKIQINSNLKKIKIYQKPILFEDYHSINIVIKNYNKVILDEKIIDKEFLKYGYYIIDLSNLKLDKNKDYYFQIKTDKNDNNKYSLNLYYPNNNKLIFNILFITITILFSCVYYIVNKKNFDFSKSFYKIAIPIFILYIVFIPITAGHDEQFHLIKANEIASGILIPTINNNKSGAYLPDDIDLDLNYWENYKYSDYLNRFNHSYNSNISFLSAGSIDVYSPLAYLPQSIGIFISKHISNSVILASYIGRLFNMLVCVLLLSLAIKITPIGKKILFLFSFNPLTIECFTTLSCDGLTICLGVLFVSYLLKVKQQDEVTKKNVTILSLLSCALALLKIIYIIIPFLIFIISKDKFKDLSRKKSILFIIIFPIIINLLWLFLASSVSYGASPYSIPGKSLLLFLHNPFNFIKYFIYSIETYGFKIFTEFFSNKLLMGEVISNNTIVPILMIVTSMYVIKDSNEEKLVLTKSNLLFIIAILLLLLVATFLSVYIFYIPYRDLSIWIVQGRYFYPEILIIYLLISSLVKHESKKYTNYLIFITIIVVNIMSLMEIIVNYL